MNVLLLLPPMTQVNTPYPSTQYLAGYLTTIGHKVSQYDVGIKTIRTLLSRAGLLRIREELSRSPDARSQDASKQFLKNFDGYYNQIEEVLSFLEGRNPGFENEILDKYVLPLSRGEIQMAFNPALADRVRKLDSKKLAMAKAGFFLNDILVAIRVLDPAFKFQKYAERISASESHLSGILRKVSETTLVTEVVREVVEDCIDANSFDLVGISVPFEGNILGAFLIAKAVREISPGTKIVMGGGYPNTSLRNLSDSRAFDYFDFVVLDDGERPLANILEHLSGNREEKDLLRTFVRSEDGEVKFYTTSQHDIPQKSVGTPDVCGPDSMLYFADTMDMQFLNDLMFLYSTTRWNKLTIAHGCYWRRCTFCDIELDYINRYDYAGPDILIDRITQIVERTGNTNFHFVDEACPPTALASLSKRLLVKDIKIQWIGNIRFDRAFTSKMTRLLASAGCRGVTGGLEVASDRVLKLMEKGTSVPQVARVAHAFSEAGVMVHAYLMYGFPTQTEQEIVDSLEVVRQMMELKILTSAAWHRFVVTKHSPVGVNPEKYGITLRPIPNRPGKVFDEYVIPHFDPTIPEDRMVSLGAGLRKALASFMAGVDLERSVTDWFDIKVPETTLVSDCVANALTGQASRTKASNSVGYSA